MKLVNLTLKIPEGSEEFVKKQVMEGVKDFLVEQKRTETDSIQAEIDNDFELIKEANEPKEEIKGD